MSKPDLDAIQKRADAATDGPWKAENLEQDHGHKGIFWVSVDHQHQIKTVAEVDSNDDGIEAIWRMSDAEFIAHARTDVPALLAYARDLEARLKEAQGDAWELGVIHGHNAEGRLIDKREANPYRAALTATEEQA